MSFKMRTKRGDKRVQNSVDRALGSIIVGDENSATNAASILRKRMVDMGQSKTYPEALELPTTSAVASTFIDGLKKLGFAPKVQTTCVKTITGKKKG